jgi:hypothetical protein
VGRGFGAVSVVLACVLMAGCGSAPWWKQTGTSACVSPALVRVAGHVMPVGNCAGSFWVPAEKVTLHVGEAIDIHMAEGPAGASASRLVPVNPLPHSVGSAVLKRIATSPDKATATYKAQHPGHVMLITRASCLGPGLNGKVRDNCPVLSVTVIP